MKWTETDVERGEVLSTEVRCWWAFVFNIHYWAARMMIWFSTSIAQSRAGSVAWYLEVDKNNLHTLFVWKTLSAKISRSFTLQKSDDVWLPWNLEHNSINLNQSQIIQKWNFHLLLFRMRNFRNVRRKVSKKKLHNMSEIDIPSQPKNTSYVRIQRDEIRAQWLKKRRRDTFNRDPGGPVAGEHLPISSYTLLFRALELEYRTNSSSFLPSSKPHLVFNFLILLRFIAIFSLSLLAFNFLLCLFYEVIAKEFQNSILSFFFLS